MTKARIQHPGRCAAALAFTAAYGFFQFAYPYHLIRREQMNLFAFDGDFIRQTYRGAGWLARFVTDFLEQFFHLPVAGPLIVALLLTGIGVAAYRICRHFLGRRPALIIATVLYAWSFLRETGNLFSTRYTLVVLGYLALVLAALQFRKAWLRPAAAVLFLLFGIWSLGAPVHKDYGKPWGTPRFRYDRLIGMDAEIARERWDKVLRLARTDLYMVEARFCYDLAHAMKGDLGQKLFDHSQGTSEHLLLRVSTDRSIFTNCLAGEAWFHLGDMTMAEQSAIIALQASPKHTGTRFLIRLARVNLISGEEAAAQKYLNLLSRTLFYGKWARSMMPGQQDETTRRRLEQARSKLVQKDFVHHSDNPRAILLGLLEANPGNTLARSYLLCYDLMDYDLEHFMEDYAPNPVKAHIYHEAVLIWLSQHDRMTPEQLTRYGISLSTAGSMDSFFRNPAAFDNTYWYYYLKAIQEQ